MSELDNIFQAVQGLVSKVDLPVEAPPPVEVPERSRDDTAGVSEVLVPVVLPDGSQELEATAEVMQDFGRDNTPTVAMIREGNFGNGSYQQYDQDLLKQQQQERSDRKHEAKMAAIEKYEERLVKEIEGIAEIRAKLANIGHKIVADKPNGVPFTEAEVNTLRLIDKNIGTVEDRIIGKAGSDTAEKAGDISIQILQMFTGDR